MKKTILGIIIELAAFVILIFSERWGIPYTFAVYAHIWGVYLFTKGLDLKLSEIHFTRELCFLFAFFFPIAGMTGILFYLFVLKQIDDTVLGAFSHSDDDFAGQEKGENANTIIEYIQLPSLPAAPLRKNQIDTLFGTLLSHEHDIATGLLDREKMKNTYYTVDEFENEQAKYRKKINSLESLCANNPSDIGQINALANIHFEYATTLVDDHHIRKLHLQKAMKLYESVIDSVGNELYLLEKLLHIHFFLDDINGTLGYCKEILKRDPAYSPAHLRLMECFYHKKDFKRLAQAAQNARQILKANDFVRDIAEMWHTYA
ncbi:MAG: hypothetical protein JW904_01135 [Spirochaetales bacterium]|nr:hypothetical protein [Spirochaetales bacterium]